MTQFNLNDPLWDVDYWTTKLEGELDVIRPLLRKAHDNCRDFSVLTTEEQYRLVEALYQMGAHVSLLREDLVDQQTQTSKKRKKAPFWQKILRK